MNNIKKLVTLGPSSLCSKTIKELDKHDIFVFRINLSHTPIDELETTIRKIQDNTDTPICIDSEGAQIRNHRMRSERIFYKKGDYVKIHFDDIEGDSKNISFAPRGIAREFRIGDILSVDFHEVSLRIESISRNYCNALITNEGLVSSNKAVDLNREIDLRSITEKDEKAIEISRKMDVGHFALSFASDERAVEIFRKKVGNDSYLISKIECLSGLKNLQAIIGRTDALLIDRGDLSRQTPVEKIPFFQRRIISLSKSKAKPVFVATNLLETMVATKQPSRAEVNDVISTLDMGASGLVLAAETAIGKYPVECVEMISRLIRQYEYWTPNTSIQELLLN